MSATAYRSTQRNITEELNSHQHPSETSVLHPALLL